MQEKVNKNVKFDNFEKLNSITVFKLLSKMSSTLKQLENKTAIRKLVAALRKIGSRVTPKCGTLRKFTQTTKKKQAILLEAFIYSEFFLQQNGKKFFITKPHTNISFKFKDIFKLFTEKSFRAK